MRIGEFCRRHHVKRLALYGSVLSKDFRPESDVDVLVGFAPGQAVGLIRLVAIAEELSGILGHKLDLRTPAELSRCFRQEVVDSAEVLYDGDLP